MQEKGILYNLTAAQEVAPPTRVWQAIADRLDNEFSVAPTIQAQEKTPDEIVWQKIKNSLDKADVKTIAPFEKKRKINLVPWLVAACSIGIIALTIPILKNTKNSHIAAGNIASVVLPHKADTTSPTSQADVLNAGLAQKKYITIAGINGDPIKLSTKLQPMAVYLYPKKNAKTIAATKNKWNNKLKSWKTNINTNAKNPQSNFANPIDLLQFLQTQK
jgi:hypothetical protein